MVLVLVVSRPAVAKQVSQVMVVEIMNEGSEKYKFAKNLRWHSYSRMHYANHQVWKVSTEFRYLYFHSIIQFFF